MGDIARDMVELPGFHRVVLAIDGENRFAPQAQTHLLMRVDMLGGFGAQHPDGIQDSHVLVGPQQLGGDAGMLAQGPVFHLLETDRLFRVADLMSQTATTSTFGIIWREKACTPKR